MKVTIKVTAKGGATGTVKSAGNICSTSATFKGRSQLNLRERSPRASRLLGAGTMLRPWTTANRGRIMEAAPGR